MYWIRRNGKDQKNAQGICRNKDGQRPSLKKKPVRKQLPSWLTERKVRSNAELLNNIPNLIDSAQKRTGKWAGEINSPGIFGQPMPRNMFPTGPLHF